MAGPQYGFGSGVLYGTRIYAGVSTPVRFGVLQDVTVDFASEIKELFGQLQYPVDAARGKAKITGKAKFAVLQASVYNNIYFGQASTAGQTLFAYNEQTPALATATAATSIAASSGTTLTFSAVPAGVAVGATVTDVTTPSAIPSGTTVVSQTSTTVTLSAAVSGVLIGDSILFAPSATAANSSDFVEDLGVYYSLTGLPLSLTASSPAQGQYSVAGGVYNFSAADAGQVVLLSYSYGQSSSGRTITGSNVLMGTTPKFRVNLQNSYEGHTLALTLYSVVSSKLNFPTKLDDYVYNELDFSAFADPAGRVFQMSLDN
jgi:hypothetical protein